MEMNELPGITQKPAKRGRPSSGTAMTAAKRKKLQRERDLTKLWENNNLNDVTITGLIGMLAMATKPGWDANGVMAKMVWEELGKRRGFM